MSKEDHSPILDDITPIWRTAEGPKEFRGWVEVLARAPRKQDIYSGEVVQFRMRGDGIAVYCTLQHAINKANADPVSKYSGE